MAVTTWRPRPSGRVRRRIKADEVKSAQQQPLTSRLEHVKVAAAFEKEKRNDDIPVRQLQIDPYPSPTIGLLLDAASQRIAMRLVRRQRMKVDFHVNFVGRVAGSRIFRVTRDQAHIGVRWRADPDGRAINTAGDMTGGSHRKRMHALGS